MILLRKQKQKLLKWIKFKRIVGYCFVFKFGKVITIYINLNLTKNFKYIMIICAFSCLIIKKTNKIVDIDPSNQDCILSTTVHEGLWWFVKGHDGSWRQQWRWQLINNIFACKLLLHYNGRLQVDVCFCSITLTLPSSNN